MAFLSNYGVLGRKSQPPMSRHRRCRSGHIIMTFLQRPILGHLKLTFAVVQWAKVNILLFVIRDAWPSAGEGAGGSFSACPSVCLDTTQSLFLRAFIRVVVEYRTAQPLVKHSHTSPKICKSIYFIFPTLLQHFYQSNLVTCRVRKLVNLWVLVLCSSHPHHAWPTFDETIHLLPDLPGSRGRLVEWGTVSMLQYGSRTWILRWSST